jgi:CMP-N,N'-diacetyllegionaminic acid synthase
MPKRRYLGLIPARGGSKRIPDKNIRQLCGKPLIQYTIEAARESKALWKTIVSTDDEKIMKVTRNCGAEIPFVRPANLALDETPTFPVVKHALDFYKESPPDAIVLLQPTSPLRISRDIIDAIKLFEQSGADTVVGISEEPVKLATMLKAVTEKPYLTLEMPKILTPNESRYRLNGAIYVIKSSTILEKNTLFGEKVIGYLMPGSRSVDVDTMEDWRMVELLMSGGNPN